MLLSNKGNDTLNGGFGDDLYVYSKNQGSDEINEMGGRDTLILKNLSQEDVDFTTQGKDLIISIKGTDDTITIKNHYR